MRLIHGTKGYDDRLSFHSQSDSVAVFGGRGRDIIMGSQGDDVLVGGRGADRLTGGYGNDVLIGGRGADIFVWRGPCDGVDVIADFGPSDTLVLGDILARDQFDTRVDYDQATGSVFVDGTLAVVLSAGVAFGWEDISV